MQSIVSKAYKQVKEKGKARLFKSYSKEYGNGEQKRDFIYVKDAVDMTIYFGENKIVNGIYNVGTGNANTFNSFVKPIFKALGVKENIEYFEMPEVLQGRYQDFTQANMDKIRKTGYKGTFTSIEDAVIDYVKNYLDSDYQYLN